MIMTRAVSVSLHPRTSRVVMIIQDDALATSLHFFLCDFQRFLWQTVEQYFSSLQFAQTNSAPPSSLFPFPHAAHPSGKSPSTLAKSLISSLNSTPLSSRYPTSAFILFSCPVSSITSILAYAVRARTSENIGDECGSLGSICAAICWNVRSRKSHMK